MIFIAVNLVQITDAGRYCDAHLSLNQRNTEWGFSLPLANYDRHIFHLATIVSLLSLMSIWGGGGCSAHCRYLCGGCSPNEQTATRSVATGIGHLVVIFCKMK